MNELTIKDLGWNEDLMGYIATLSNNKIVQIQFEKNTNRLHADFGNFYAIIDKQNDYEYCLTSDEELAVRKLITCNKEIRAKEIELDNQIEDEEDE